MRRTLTEAQLEYLRTGKTNDPDVFLDWTHGRDRGKVQRVFEEIRGDYPAGAFLWAEMEFGGKR